MSALVRIANATRNTRWENQVFLVGGAVRDLLLHEWGESNNIAENDIDLVLEGDAGELARHLFDTGVSSISPVVYPRFGTAMVRIDNVNVEIVTARKESYREDSRKPSVEPATLREDILRRDFTINSLLKNIHTGEILDLLRSAQDDLKNKILRTPLDPETTFSDDPLRMVRAIRFKVRFSLEYAPGLWDAIIENAHRLKIVSAERFRDEFVKMLQAPRADEALAELMASELLDIFAPEFRKGVGVEQGSYHSKDVWGHTLDVVRQADGSELLVCLGALFHDIGKPNTHTVQPDGRVRFFGHEDEGARLTRSILRRLRFPNDIVDSVAKLVKNHMRLGSAIPFTPSAARRLKRDLGELVEPLLKVCQADAQAQARIPKGIDFSEVRRQLANVSTVAKNSSFDSPLTGDEIMRIANIGPGPKIAKFKKVLSDAVVEGRIEADDAQGAEDLLRNFLKLDT